MLLVLWRFWFLIIFQMFALMACSCRGYKCSLLLLQYQLLRRWVYRRRERRMKRMKGRMREKM